MAVLGILSVHAVALAVAVARSWVRRHGTREARRHAQARVIALELRHTIEDLGVAATKLGQILSTRPDVLAPEYAQELARLQDAAPPEPPGTVEQAIETELGPRWHDLIASLDPTPLAAASIGQAHAGVLRDGTEVVVKVRRPGVVEQVALDLDVLERAADSASRWSARARRADLRDLVREFSDTLRAELDYEREAENAERFAAAFATRADVHIPRIHRDATTARVITLDRIRGIKLDDVDALDTAGIDRNELARRSADVVLSMVFELRCFHADPHPGNFFVEKDGRLGIIDFGMVGTLDPTTTAALLAFLAALATGDAAELGRAATALGVTTDVVDRDALLDDLQTLVTGHLRRPLGEIALGPLLGDVLGVFRRHGLRFPHNLALLAKTFAMCEGVAATLDPSFRMTAAIVPYVQRLAADLSEAEASEPETSDPEVSRD